MIVLALRLKAALLRGSLRPGPGANARRVALGASAALGALLSLSGFLGLSVLHGRPQANDAAIVLFTALVIGWTVLPILTFSSDDLLDASKLALLPLSKRQILTLHGVGALVGVAPVATAFAVLGLVIGSGHSPLSYVVALIAAVVELALCVVTSRTVAALLSRLLRSRRGRDLGVAVTALVVISGQLINPVLQRLGQGQAGSDRLHAIARAVRSLPPGLVASAPRAGSFAVLHLLAGVAVVLVLLVVWERALSRAEEVADATTGTRRGRDRLTGLLPANRIGAVASKDLRYLTREPRRLIQILTSTLLPAIFVVISPALSDGGGLHPGMVFAVCGMSLFFGLASANRFGQEGSASWLLVASMSRRAEARSDLIGGDLALGIVGLPLLVLAGVVLAVVTGGWGLLGTALASSVGILGLSLGGGALLSVLAPYPVPAGPRNAFSNGGGGQGLAASLLGLAVMVGVAVVCLPMLVLLLPALHGHDLLAYAVAAPLYGLGIGAAARELAARMWADQAPEVLLKVAIDR